MLAIYTVKKTWEIISLMILMFRVLFIFFALEKDLSVQASQEASVQVPVTSVTSSDSFGWRIVGYSHVLFPDLAIGEPDNLGAILLENGWIIVELKKDVDLSTKLSIWASAVGKSAKFQVFLSLDHLVWFFIGEIPVTESGYSNYELTGDFGTVRYVKIVCTNETGPDLLFVDAIMVRGGSA